MKFGLLDLINAVGQENIKVQVLFESATSFTYKKKAEATSITFLTAEVSANDFLDLNRNSKIGLVLWIPRDKLPPEMLKK